MTRGGAGKGGETASSGPKGSGGRRAKALVTAGAASKSPDHSPQGPGLPRGFYLNGPSADRTVPRTSRGPRGSLRARAPSQARTRRKRRGATTFGGQREPKDPNRHSDPRLLTQPSPPPTTVELNG